MSAMIRRWLIRLPFLLALALVVGAWIRSYFGELDVYQMTKGFYWDVGAVRGQGFLGVDLSSPYPVKPLTFSFSSGETREDFLNAPTTWGFYGGPVPLWRDAYVIIFPLWLPTLLLAVGNGFVWRKTKKRNTGQGFPIEPSTKPK
jgi:hypothetical protein